MGIDVRNTQRFNLKHKDNDKIYKIPISYGMDMKFMNCPVVIDFGANDSLKAIRPTT